MNPPEETMILPSDKELKRLLVAVDEATTYGRVRVYKDLRQKGYTHDESLRAANQIRHINKQKP